MASMKIWISALLFLSSFTILQAQEEDAGEKALKQVLEILTLQEPQLPAEGEMTSLLQKGAWEALSYLNESEDDYTSEDLLEAVADYYNYQEDEVIIKLINPQDYNSYGMEVNVKYLLNKDNIELLTAKGAVKDSWQLLYLDHNYLALDMGDIRVFFTHTPAQE